VRGRFLCFLTEIAVKKHQNKSLPYSDADYRFLDLPQKILDDDGKKT